MDDGKNSRDETKGASDAPKGEAKKQDAAKKQDGQGQPEQALQLEDMRDKFLRLAAEFDNYKKRVAVELADAKETGKAELLKSLLNVVDEFDLMLIAAGRSEDRPLAKGMELLYANLMDALEKAGLKEIGTDGRFDPYRHEIVMVRDDSGREEGHILEVVKKGYTLNDRLLRASSVIVAKPKAVEPDLPDDTEDRGGESDTGDEAE